MSECPDHVFYSANPHFCVVRCSHIGDRYVIQTAHKQTGELLALDYVQRLPEAPYLVESGFPSRETVDRVWDRFVERMRADDPPRPN